MDHVNLIRLKGDTQEQVEAVATEGKTKGTATVESFPTKTKMFEELARMKRFKMLEKETEKEEKRKVEEPILKEMKVKISEWQEQRKVSTIPTNFLKKMTIWYENFKIKMKEK